jgi:hypothetical protein
MRLTSGLWLPGTISGQGEFHIHKTKVHIPVRGAILHSSMSVHATGTTGLGGSIMDALLLFPSRPGEQWVVVEITPR